MEELNPFYRLSPFIREYIYTHNWQTLRPVQAAACKIIFDTDKNLLLSDRETKLTSHIR